MTQQTNLPPLFDLSGKVALVTGSSRGIGRAIAERLAEHGARVVISSRKQDACEAVAVAINAAHGAGRATAIAASISDKPALEAMMARVRGEVGPVDILVCNAASNPHFGSLDTISDEAFRKVLENNILSNHWLIQRALPDMRAAGGGAIIVISSVAGLYASPTIGAYGVSKAADLALVRNYALENGPHNVRVNAIVPGIVKTDFAKALWQDEALNKRAIRATPLQRLGEPDDIAGAAVFLAAPAGGWMTGQLMVIDGGVTCTTVL